MPRSGWIALLSVLLLTGGYALGVFTGDGLKAKMHSRGERPEGSAKPPREAVFALGKLQPVGGIVPVVGPPGDRIDKLCVRPGQAVKGGDTLLVLASQKDREEEVHLARKQLAEGKTQLAAILRSRAAKLAEVKQKQGALKTTEAADLKAQQLKIAFLRKQKTAARHRQERLAGLDQNLVTVSAQEKDQVALAVAQAESELEAALSGLDAARHKYQTQKEAAEAAEISVKAELDLAEARVPISSLEQNLRLATVRRERAELKAPVGGTVIQVIANVGDPTGAGPVLQIAAGEGMVATAEVYATDVDVLIGWLDGGRAIKSKVTGPALGEKTALAGRVNGPQAIGRMVAANRVAGFTPRADSDRRVVEVRVELDRDCWKKAGQFVGLEVNVEFSPTGAATTPP